MILATLLISFLVIPMSEQVDMAQLAGNWLTLEANGTTLEDVEAHNAIPRKLYLAGPAGQRVLLMLPQSHFASSASFVHYWRWKALLTGDEESARIMLAYAPQDCTSIGLPSSLVKAVTEKLKNQGSCSRQILARIERDKSP